MSRVVTFASLSVLAFSVTANATVTSFFGIDPNAGTTTSSRPNSDAAAASFDSALGSGLVGTIDFDDLAVGYYTNVTVAPGVQLTTTNTVNDADAGVFNTTSAATTGFAISVPNFFKFVPDSNFPQTHLQTYSFANPINSWGAYITGLGTANGSLFLEFNDGTAQSIALVGDDAGGTIFTGFISDATPVNSITLRLFRDAGSRDIYGIDDIRYGNVNVPEPAALSALGAIGLLALRRKSR